jgi:hypothetical protein
LLSRWGTLKTVSRGGRLSGGHLLKTTSGPPQKRPRLSPSPGWKNLGQDFVVTEKTGEKITFYSKKSRKIGEKITFFSKKITQNRCQKSLSSTQKPLFAPIFCYISSHTLWLL